MSNEYLLDLYNNVSKLMIVLNGGSVGFMLTFGVAYLFDRKNYDVAIQNKLKIMTTISTILLIITSLFLLFAPSRVLIAKLLGVKY
ncbi:MAG: hypothetical protein ACRDBY_12840 [Cetobacterium sp.]